MVQTAVTGNNNNSAFPEGAAPLSGGTARHFNLRLNRKLFAGDAGFLPVPLKLCDSPLKGANCRERRLQVLVDAPLARRQKGGGVTSGAMAAVVLILFLGLRESSLQLLAVWLKSRS